MKRQRGFTLTELMVTVVVAAILMVVAIPSFLDFSERRRVMGAAEFIYEQLMYARTEAVKRSRPLVVSFSANNTTTWALGITDRNTSGSSGCDPTITDAANAAACTIEYDNNTAVDADGDGSGTDPVLVRYDSTPFSQVKMKGESGNAPSFTNAVVVCNTTTAQACFDPVRGTASNGTVVVGTDKYEAWVVVGAMGRVRICSPSAKKIYNYQTCS